MAYNSLTHIGVFTLGTPEITTGEDRFRARSSVWFGILPAGHGKTTLSQRDERILDIDDFRKYLNYKSRLSELREHGYDEDGPYCTLMRDMTMHVINDFNLKDCLILTQTLSQVPHVYRHQIAFDYKLPEEVLLGVSDRRSVDTERSGYKLAYLTLRDWVLSRGRTLPDHATVADHILRQCDFRVDHGIYYKYPYHSTVMEHIDRITSLRHSRPTHVYAYIAFCYSGEEGGEPITKHVRNLSLDSTLRLFFSTAGCEMVGSLSEVRVNYRRTYRGYADVLEVFFMPTMRPRYMGKCLELPNARSASYGKLLESERSHTVSVDIRVARPLAFVIDIRPDCLYVYRQFVPYLYVDTPCRRAASSLHCGLYYTFKYFLGQLPAKIIFHYINLPTAMAFYFSKGRFVDHREGVSLSHRALRDYFEETGRNLDSIANLVMPDPISYNGSVRRLLNTITAKYERRKGDRSRYK
jgi:hypothetical protein